MSQIIVLIDMDCFYVQVEQKLNPSLRDLPCAVVQYKPWKGGCIIAVNYEARALGVRRGMFGDDAKKLCPNIELPRVKEIRGKADLTRYRDGSKEIFDVLLQFTNYVEKASIDEAYLDITELVKNRVEHEFSQKKVTAEDLPTTCIIPGSKCEDIDQVELLKDWLEEIYSEEIASCDISLAVAGVIMEEIRAEILKKTMYKCSAGIAHNKMLAKYICGLHKPNRQTILPQSSLTQLYVELPLKKIRNLGGKLGDTLVEEFGCNTMSDLSKITSRQLQNYFGDKTGKWLYDLGKGIENDPVNPRQIVKSIGCSKHFFGKSALKTQKDVKYWLMQFAEEIVERGLHDQESNKRMARVLTVTLKIGNIPNATDVTRSCPVTMYDSKKISQDAFSLVQKFNMSKTDLWFPPLLSMSMSIGKFQDRLQGNSSIESFLQKGTSAIQQNRENEIDDTTIHEEAVSCVLPINEISTTDVLTQMESKELSTSNAPSCSFFLNNKDFKRGFFITRLEKSNNSHEIMNKEKPLLNKKNIVLGEDKKRSPDITEKFEKKQTLKASKSCGILKYLMPLTNSNETMKDLEEYQHNNKQYFEFRDVPSTSKMLTDDTNEINFNLLGSFENELFCASDSKVMIRCSTCNEKVLAKEMCEHEDFHVADRLQYEFSNESLEAPINSNKFHEHVSNGKFLDLSIDEDGKITCLKCEKQLTEQEIDEHQDYHMAQRLQSEINSTSVQRSKHIVNKKRKLKKQQNTDKKIQVLDAYFNK